MNKKQKVIYNIKKITIEELLKYFNPKIVHNYCKQCPDYDKFWSCPEFSFNEKQYLRQYNYAFIISAKLYAGEDEINSYYSQLRKIFDKKLLELEKKYKHTTSLFAGRCYLCDICSKLSNKPCIYPEYMRYSLESLGIEVTKIVEEVLKDKIIWSNDSKQEYILLVGGLLSKENITLNNLSLFS